MKIWQADCRDIGNKLPPMTTENCAVPIKKKTSPFCSKQTEFTGCLIPALKMSMDKIAGKNSSDNSYRYTQVLVRFTITHLEGNEMELRIKTFLGERKKTVMFSQMEQDPTPATPEEAMELDKKNKELHTYTYQFRRIH